MGSIIRYSDFSGEKVVVVKDAAHPMAWEMPDATARAIKGIIG